MPSAISNPSPTSTTHSDSARHHVRVGCPQSPDGPRAPYPSAELGRISPDGVSYVGGAHWATVLDSIAELKEHLDWELDDSQSVATAEESLPGSPVTGPLLLCGPPRRTTREEILASVPPRPVVDRWISKYFNALDMAPGTCSLILPLFIVSCIILVHGLVPAGTSSSTCQRVLS